MCVKVNSGPGTHARPPWKVTKPPEPEIRDTRERIQLASRFGPSLISLPPSSSRLPLPSLLPALSASLGIVCKRAFSSS